MKRQTLDAEQQHVGKFFDGTPRPLEISETILLCLFVATYPFSWQWALYVGAAVLVNAVARMICYRSFGNHYSKLAKAAIIMFPALYVVYLTSMAYSSNTADGWETLFHKLPMVLFPTYFLCAGLQYLSKRRLRLIGYAFALSCTAVALANIVGDLYKVAFQGAAGSIFYGAHKFTAHHTYNAMYFLFSMAFLYIDNKHYRNVLPNWWRIVCNVCTAFLIAVTWFVGSRSGILILIFLVLWFLYDVTFGNGHKKAGVWLTGGVALALAATLFAGQGAHNRLGATLRDATSGEQEDIRYEIWGNAMQVIGDNLALGVGVGDRIDALKDNHARNYADTRWHNYNPHNQFLDAWVSAGLAAFLLTLAVFILPAIYVFREKPFFSLLLVFVTIAFVTSLVESVLERQMGIMFFCFGCCLLLLPQSRPAAANSAPAKK